MKLKKGLFACIFLSLLFFLPDYFPAAFAAEAGSTGPVAPAQSELGDVLRNSPAQKRQVAPNPYPDLPDEYIQEAQRYFTRCESKASMNQYYDCRCLALKYLDQRIKMGPDALEQTISLKINRECADATIAAGNEYNKCMQNATLMPPKIPAKEYCECYANTYAKIYEKSRAAPGSKAFVELRSRAYIACQDEGLARKLYPGQFPPNSKMP